MKKKKHVSKIKKYVEKILNTIVSKKDDMYYFLYGDMHMKIRSW